jgi:acetoacetyl-CoA synthetase
MDTKLRTETNPAVESQAAAFARFCEEQTGVRLTTPQDLHAFSVQDFRRFWSLFLRWSDLPHSGDTEPVCSDDRCEEATFFPALRLSYAECLLGFRSAEDDRRAALVACHGSGSTERVSRGELRDRVRTLAGHLRELGVGSGDHVAAIAANNPEAIVGALAAATVGATFSSASPEMGAAAILSRFEQLSSKLLLANLSSESAGGAAGLAELVATVSASLPGLSALLALDDGPAPAGIAVPVLRLTDLLSSPPTVALADGWERFPFNHPLFILFTSGTTGPPKCIVHGAGGTLLEHLKEHRLHVDLRAEDTLFFQTSAAWMMWNWQLSALACGCPIVTFDGRLSGPETLWEIVAEEGVTVFGTSPPYLRLCEERGYSPRSQAPPRRLRSVLSTGSVLRDWQFDWVQAEVGAVRIESISGGTDIVGCFVLGHPDLPVRRGMIQSRSLGLDVQALATETTASASPVGELVCRNPFPSRPLGILGDDGRRFHDAYFAQNPGVWTHGDLIEFDADGQSRVHGRSDGVLNIQGVRIGPSEIYQALRAVPEIVEAMAVEREREGGPCLVLLVVLQEGVSLDGELTLRVRRAIARDTSALHVPEQIVAVEALPLTHSGKRSERAGRDAVNDRPVGNLRALANPGSIERIRLAVARADSANGGRSPRAVPEGAPTIEKLRAIWEALLDVEPIADDDDYFEIGGSSLMAVNLFFLISERLAVELPLSTLLEAPTIAKLAAAIDDPSKLSGSLVAMRPGAGAIAKPLYLIHSVWGDVIGMRDLALAVRPDVPVYGIRARLFDPEREPRPTIERLARTYVELIRANQTEGPYRVAGHSLGGLIAFEIARQLSERGEEVWLGVIDAEVSTAALPWARRWGHRVALPYHWSRAVLANPGGAVDKALHEILPNLLRRGLRINANARLGEPPPSWMDNATATHRKMAVAYLEAAAAFRPLPYRGSMTYFLPEIRRFHVFADPLPVWRRVSAGRVEIEPVPGPHVGMVSGERARLVAGHIDRHLSAAAADHPPDGR